MNLLQLFAGGCYRIVQPLDLCINLVGLDLLFGDCVRRVVVLETAADGDPGGGDQPAQTYLPGVGRLLSVYL